MRDNILSPLPDIFKYAYTDVILAEARIQSYPIPAGFQFSLE
jgi:hypothetical protein